jgi:Skp family chaperone for outer membrane proteins
MSRRIPMRARRAMYFALIFAGVVVASLRWAASQPAQAPFKIAVLDLRRLTDQCQMRRDKETELNRMKDAEEAKLKEQGQALDRMKAELDGLPKDDPQLAEKSKQYGRRQEEFMLRKRWAEADVLETWDKTFQSVYGDLLARVEEFREKNGYDIILRYDSQALGAGGARIIDQLDRKIVMARARSVDVTDAVVHYINETYEQQKRR